MTNDKQIWYTWGYTLENGTYLFSGASYDTISNALNAAMYSAIAKLTQVADIEVRPTT